MNEEKNRTKDSPPAHGHDLLDVPVVRVQLLLLPRRRRDHGEAAVGEAVPHERGPPERGDRQRQPEERHPQRDIDGRVARVGPGLEEELLALVVGVGADGEVLAGRGGRGNGSLGRGGAAAAVLAALAVGHLPLGLLQGGEAGLEGRVGVLGGGGGVVVWEELVDGERETKREKRAREMKRKEEEEEVGGGERNSKEREREKGVSAEKRARASICFFLVFK